MEPLGLQYDGGEHYAWLFPVEGMYDVVVRFHSREQEFTTWTGRLESSELRIVVRRPVDPPTGQALAAWAGAKQGVAGLAQHKQPPPEVILACESVVSNHAKTPYSPYAEYLLALYEEDPSTRVEALSDLVRHRPDFYLVDQAMYEIAEALDQAGLNSGSARAAAVQNNPNHVARIDTPSGIRW